MATHDTRMSRSLAARASPGVMAGKGLDIGVTPGVMAGKGDVGGFGRGPRDSVSYPVDSFFSRAPSSLQAFLRARMKKNAARPSGAGAGAGAGVGPQVFPPGSRPGRSARQPYQDVAMEKGWGDYGPSIGGKSVLSSTGGPSGYFGGAKTYEEARAYSRAQASKPVTKKKLGVPSQPWLRTQTSGTAQSPQVFGQPPSFQDLRERWARQGQSATTAGYYRG